MKFHKTIRFKLTLWYSLIFIILSFFLVAIVNGAITQHYNKGFPKGFKGRMEIEIDEETLEKLLFSEKEITIKDLLDETRNQDLQEIRKILWIAFVICVSLSFIGGYLIAGRMLAPIKKINKATKDIDVNNLHKQIDHEDVGDEISEMINHINDMITRLNHSFQLQKQFVENASHELKTPLAVVLTNLEAAKLEKCLNYEQVSNIDTAIKTSKLMNKLIEDLLLLSVVDRDVVFSKVDIKQILTEVEKQLQIIAEKKQIKLTLKIDTDDYSFNGNEPLLYRAIMNVIENAINYSKKQGEVILKLSKANNKIEFKCIDNGIGISKDKQDKVFNRFYRADKSRAKQSGGTGLGLAITQKIIQIHKGNISLTSEPDLGTEVKISL